MMQTLHRRECCRLCGSRRLELALPMKASPIGDAYVPASRLNEPQDLYPLDLYLCGDCGHVQNLDIVDPESLFRDYLFTTNSSSGLVEHFRAYAEDVLSRLKPRPGSLVAEIGSNDGSLLRFFKDKGMRVLGVDPARDIAKQATASGIETLPEFFTSELAAQIRKKHGPAAVFCANNVFAHIDNLTDIVFGIRDLLAQDGVFVFEVSYLVDIVDRFLFDTIYHEHVSHHSIAPLAKFFEKTGMQLIDVQRNMSKGGSIRGFAQRLEGKRPVQPIVNELIAAEKTRGFDRLPLYRDYAARIERLRAAANSFIDNEIARGKTVAGYGASTTTTTLMWSFDLAGKLAFVADDNPKKQGLFCPACHIPVLPSAELYTRRPDYTVILAWQYADAILKKHERFMKEGGKFILPLPALKIFP
ncbi:MAG TPA: class I SAM-dependent methyltransferase [Candidatus Omnitrophota bacterium]|nr:class I SAM-dependent methyltransferase [Candidatus Omnitrophota bacterium]HRY85186.1 class I SAM-dependent methyltransferase [Candidatus Omnitrophota bacterium]